LQKLVADLYDTPPRLVERARQALTVGEAVMMIVFLTIAEGC
jgi:hypothetical protein